MSNPTMPGMKMYDSDAIENIARNYEAMLPKQFGGAVNLYVHPMAGVAAFSAIGLGMTSQALGMWMGALAGAAEASRRMFEDASLRHDGSAVTAGRELVSSIAKPEAVAAAMRTAAAEAERVSDKVADSARAVAGDAVREAETAARSAERLSQVLVAAASDRPASGPSKPKGIDRPETVDDLKAISGIGPKLEQVLNGFGIWTYEQVAALSPSEIEWLDAELGFAGRIGRDESRMKRVLATAFYTVMRKLARVPYQGQAGDFRLMSRRVVDALLLMPERHRFLRGMTRWVGFPQGTIHYDQDARFDGHSKYTLRAMVRVPELSAHELRQTPRLGSVQIMHLPGDVSELIGCCQAGTHPLCLVLHQDNPAPHTGLPTAEEYAV
jgi:NADH-quinone oxidoreductase subunit E